MSNIQGSVIANDGSSKEKDKKRRTPRRSEVWNHFVNDEVTKKARCMHCGGEYSSGSKGGTSHLKRHYEACIASANKRKQNHVVFDQERNKEVCVKNAERSQYKDDLQACTSGANKDVVYHYQFDQERNLELFAEMVIHGKIPLGQVENPFFTEFARHLQPMYTPVDRIAIEKSCLAYYENEKNKLRNEFVKLTSRVSFLVGIYGQKKEEEDATRYICVEAHFVDDDFKLVKRIIGFREINDWENHQIIDEVERCINGIVLSKKVLICVVAWDKGILDIDWTSQISFAICGGENIKVELFAKTLWKIASTIYWAIISDVEDIMSLCERYKDEEHSLPRKSKFLIYQSETWHSVLNMLRRALNDRNVINPYDEYDIEWEKVERVVVLLEQICRVLSYSCPTSNLFLKIYFEIQDMLFRISPTGYERNPFQITMSRILQEEISELQQQLREYLVSCSKMLIVASVLDPRFKLKFLERCNNVGIVKMEEVGEFLRDIYSEYVKASKTYSNTSFSRMTKNCSIFLELRTYLKEEHAVDANTDVLDWWKDKKTYYPVLSMMARDILAIPLSSSFFPFGFNSFEEFSSLIWNSGVGVRMSEALVCGSSFVPSTIESLEMNTMNIAEKEQKSQTGDSSFVWNETFKENTPKCIRVKCVQCNEYLSENSESHFAHHYAQACVKRPNTEKSKFLPSICSKGKALMFDQKQSRELLMKLVISSELSIKIVEDSSFVEWAKFLQPLYIPELQATIAKDGLALVLDSIKFLDELKHTSSYEVSISIAPWKFSKLEYFRLHYIDDDFNLVKRLVGLEYLVNFDRFREGSNLISWKPHIIVGVERLYDDAVNLGIYIDASCVVGTFRDIVGVILLQNKSLLIFIRRMIRHVTKTPNAMHTFNQIAIRNDVPTKLEFVLDNPERWDSSLCMLLDALAYKDVFDAYEGHDKCFCSCKKWDQVEMIIKLLKPIYEAVIMLSSDRYTTSNLILKSIVEIREIFLEASTGLETRFCIYYTLQYLTAYLVGYEKLLLVASIMDPRFKLLYVQDIIRNVKEKLTKLCEEYEMKISNNASTVNGVSLVMNGSLLSELEKYLKENTAEVADPNFNVLDWWKEMKSHYPLLSRMARDFLAIPASSVLPQYVFTLPTCRQSFESFGDNDFDTCEAFFCLKDWINATHGSGILNTSWSNVLKLSAIDSVERHVSSLHRGLNVRETLAIEFVEKLIESSSREVLVVIEGTSLTAQDIKCLISPTNEHGEDNWIHDQVMNCCFSILNVTFKQVREELFLILSASQTQWLCSLSMEEATWSRSAETGKIFLKYNWVLCPINVYKQWAVVVLDVAGKQLTILNSTVLRINSCDEIASYLILRIKKCIMLANVCPNDASLEMQSQNIPDWPVSEIPIEDNCSSGLFVLHYMLHWSECEYDDHSYCFGLECGNVFSKKLVAELIFSELNERKKIQNEILGGNKGLSSAPTLSVIDSYPAKDASSLHAGLSVREIEAIKFVKKHVESSSAEELVMMEDIRLNAQMMECLIRPTVEDGQAEWINDEVMNCYIMILNSRKRNSVAIMSTFQTQWLCSPFTDIKKSASQPWSSVEIGTKFLDYELVFFPINVQNCHWFVGVLNSKRRELQILDSLVSVGKSYGGTIGTLRKNIQACIEAAIDFSEDGLQENRQSKNILRWCTSVQSQIQQQEDRCSCGLFALKYIDLWDGRELDGKFTQEEVDLFRKKLVAEMIFSEINQRKDIQNEIIMESNKIIHDKLFDMLEV